MKKSKLIPGSAIAATIAASCVDPVSTQRDEPARPLVPFNDGIEYAQPTPQQTQTDFPTHNIPAGYVKVGEFHIFSDGYVDGAWHEKEMGWFPVYALNGDIHSRGIVLFPNGEIRYTGGTVDLSCQLLFSESNPMTTGPEDEMAFKPPGRESCRYIPTSILEPSRTIPTMDDR